MNYPNHTPSSRSGSNNNAILLFIALFGFWWLAALHFAKWNSDEHREKFLISARSDFGGDATRLWWRRLHPYLSQAFMNQVYPLVIHLDTLESSITQSFETDRFSHKDLAYRIDLYAVATREFSTLISKNSHGGDNLNNIRIYPYQDWSNPANYHTFWSYKNHCNTTLRDFRAQFAQCSHTP